MKKLGALLLLLIPVLLVGSLHAVAQSLQDWFSPGKAFQVKAVPGEPFGRLDPYNAPCTNQTFQYYHFIQSNQEQEGARTECVYSASYGEISVLGGLKLTNGDKAYRVYTDFTSFNTRIFPVVNSRDVFTLSGGAGYGREYLYIYNNLPRRVTLYEHPAFSKSVFFTLTEPIATEANKVKFQNGDTPPVDPTTLSYSGDGKLMLGNSVDYQTLINVANHSARRFGFKTPNYSGAYPKVNTALNHDGTLALINISDSSTSQLYNLGQCSGAQDGSVVEDCQKLNLFSILKSQLPNLNNVVRAQFAGDDTIYFKGRLNTPQGSVEQWFRVSLPRTGQLEYLALGDSFASGEGAYDYKTGTNVPGNGCRISLDSYGYLLKAGLGFEESEVVTCSGAKQKDIRTQKEPDYKEDSPQASGRIGSEYDQEIYSQFLPGYRRQVGFVEQYKPSAITISIGGNDIGFGEKLRYCVLTPYSCYLSQGERAAMLKEFKAQFPELVKTYQALKSASPETRIYVVGYPKLAKADGQCPLNVRLSNEEIKLAEAMVTDLNYVIEKATQKAGVVYVDTADTFTGYRLCEAGIANAAVNGLMPGDDGGLGSMKVIGSESYHPNKRGHQLYAQRIMAETNGLTVVMPEVNPAADVENMPSELLNQPSTIDVPLPIPFLPEKDLVKRGANITLETLVNSWLEPGTNYRVEIHSEVQEIGSATAQDTETLSITVQIPEDIELGAHTLHVIGVDGMGRPVDFYKHVIVIADEGDIDGDGILNHEDTCPFLEPVANDGPEEGFCVIAPTEEPNEGLGQPITESSSEGLESEPQVLADTAGTPTEVSGYQTPRFSSASSSGNNILTAPLDASPQGRWPDEPHSTIALQDSSHNNQHGHSLKKLLLILGISTPAGVLLLLRFRKAR